MAAAAIAALGCDKFAIELLGFWPALGSAGLAGLNFGASATAVESFLCHHESPFHDGLLVQPQILIDARITTATRPVLARMAEAP